MRSLQDDERSGSGASGDDAVETAIRQVERGEYAQAAPVLATIVEGGETIHSFHDLAAAVSFYGLCVAHLDHDMKRAISLCERAVRLESADPRFHENLARAFLIAGNRRKALIVVQEGLRRLPGNEHLTRLRDSFGRRMPPVLGFLSRRHPLNRFLGRLRYRLTGR